MSGKRAASILVVVLILLTMVSVAFPSEKTAPRPGSWSPMGGGLRGFELGTTSLCVYDGRLFAICEFNDVVWDGTSWQPLNNQIDGLVSTLGIWKDSLVAVISWYDSFDAKNGLVKWDGGHWKKLSDKSPESWIYKIIAWNGRIIGCGGEWLGKGKKRGYVIEWDGESWLPLGSDFNGPVESMAVYNGQLIVGGSFTKIGSSPIRNIAAWDGHAWFPLGPGLNGDVNTLNTFEGKLIAGGDFKKAGQIGVKRIAAWDGSSWSPVGKGMNKGVYALAEYEGRLIAGGRFTSAGNVSARNIAAWDGNSWSPLGSGIGGHETYVSTLAVHSEKLIVGGRFGEAGSIKANNIAVWEE